MITRLIVNDFQRVQEADIALGSATSLIGLNRSGKTSLVDALRYLITGKTERHDTLPEIVRQGAKTASVEIFTDAGRGLLRTRTASNKGEQFVDGEPKNALDFSRAIQELLGASPEAIDLALGSGALLSLPSDKLQSFLVSLTGASLGTEAIATALTQVDRNALKYLDFAIPKTLGELGSAAARAVEERRKAKQALGDRYEDLTRVPALSLERLQEIQKYAPAVLADEIEDLQESRDRALKAQGGAETRAARIAELQQVPQAKAVDLKAVTKTQTEALQAVAEAEAHLTALKRKLEVDRKLAGVEVELPADAAGIDGRLAEAEEALLQAKAQLQTAKAAGAEAKEMVESARSAGAHCPTCSQAIDGRLLEALQERYDACRAKWSEAAHQVNEAQDAFDKMKARKEEIDGIRARIEAAARVQEHTTAIATTEQDLERLKRTREAAQAAHAEALRKNEKAKEYEKAQSELQRLQAEAAQTTDVAEIEKQITGWKQVQEDQKHATERERLHQIIKGLELRIQACDVVAESCGPKGIRAALIAKAIGPFLAPANEVLGELLPGTEVDVECDDGLGFIIRANGATVRPRVLSDGEFVLVTAALQIATARLSGAPLLAIDRAELVDEPKRLLLRQVAARQCSEGLQLLMLSCNPPPKTVKPGVFAYVVDQGRVSRVPQLGAA